MPPHPPLGAMALLCASMALVGSYVGLTKLLVAVFPVVLLAGLRFAFAAVAMAGWIRRGPDEAPVGRTNHRLLALQALFGNVLFSVCMMYGVKGSDALTAGVVMSAIPAAVALLSWRLLGERIHARTWVAMALAVAGIALLALAKAPADGAAASSGVAAADGAARSPHGHGWAGPLLLAGAVFCEAMYVVIGKRLVGDLSARRVSAWLNAWGLVWMAPLALWQAAQFDFGAVTASTWALFVFYTLAASVVSVWLWMKGLTHVPASQAGIATVMLPITAAAIGVFVLHEPFSALQALALGLALAGVVVATWRPRAANPAAR